MGCSFLFHEDAIFRSRSRSKSSVPFTMKPYQTKYITPEGRTRRSRIWADDNRSAHAVLRTQGNYPIQIVEEATKGGGGTKKYKTNLKSKEVIAMLDQMEMQLGAEIAIDEALRNLDRDFPDGTA